MVWWSNAGAQVAPKRVSKKYHFWRPFRMDVDPLNGHQHPFGLDPPKKKSGPEVKKCSASQKLEEKYFPILFLKSHVISAPSGKKAPTSERVRCLHQFKEAQLENFIRLFLFFGVRTSILKGRDRYGN